jgi:pyrroline-5-carboxylate reductase
MGLMRVAILGTGKMGGALAVGIARDKGPANLVLCDHSRAKAFALARKIGARAAKTAKEAAEQADAVIIAVKPDAAGRLLEEIRMVLGETLLISLVAGLPLSYFKRRVPKTCRVALIMPNLAVQVGKGATMYYAQSDIDAKEIEALLAPTGMLIRAKKESEMDTAFLHSSGIAFFLSAIEGMAEAGKRHSIPYNQALLLSARAAEGAGAMVLEKKLRPLELEAMVSTKRGITMHGLRVLRKAKTRHHFHRAAHAVMKEAKKRRRKNR